MSSDRRFEYDKGPDLEAAESTTGTDSDGDDEGNRDEPAESDRRVAIVAGWKAGTVAGVSAFAVCFAVIYQIVGSMYAMGAYSGGETDPSRVVIAGLTSLASHGVTIEEGGEPIEAAVRYAASAGLTSHVTALVPPVILAVAGFLLVRYVHLRTRRVAGLALGSLVGSYVVLMTGLSMIARWTPERTANGTDEAATIAAATDLGAVLSIGTTALVFVAVGAAVAGLPRLLAVDR
ncbi:hypothetical protein [Natrinema longum]|uniref:DUF7978 domain-containing protein n=1 Tax=Natrinema longum TaxID=370324 RepID=A0A8A2U3J9_9EURY|nr:hypothetical protein [Natrinema longum]MBZ6494964.1 hypothetical protein [Natrinema longum]QSW83740.1 hypothetical protein J0X27_09615 [Natrinema longum]